MNRIVKGLIIGLVLGIIDVFPMVIQKLSWDACLSAFLMWIIIGFFVSTVDIKVKGVLKGILISYITILPTVTIIGAKEPFSLIPILVMTLILGSLAGYLSEKFNK